MLEIHHSGWEPSIYSRDTPFWSGTLNMYSSLNLSSTFPGRHSVDVLFGGQRVKGSPFYIEVFDVTKIRVDNFFNGNVGEQAGFSGRCIETVSQSQLIFLSYLFRSLADLWGTTVDFTTSFLHSSRFSAFRGMVFHSRPVHSLMLFSHRFLCLPLHLPP